MIVFPLTERGIKALSLADYRPHRADIHSLSGQLIRDVFGQFGIHDDRAFISPVGEGKEGFALIGTNGQHTALAKDAPVAVKEEFGRFGIDLTGAKA